VTSARELLDPARVPDDAGDERGYLDLLGGGAPRAEGPAQQLMRSTLLPVVYERWWRPAWGRVLTGVSAAGERRMATELLELGPGDRVLDVACGPGNFSREFAAVVGPEGLCVGLDASATMLDRAVRDTPGGEVAYVRGDAMALPFRDETFDAVCCFAALNLIPDPHASLREIARVLAPGGRVALLTSSTVGPFPLTALERLVARPTGMHIFGAAEITDALRDLGLREVRRRGGGFTQFVAARRGR
jgi:ubiquinone/menaquinone biosynthesis C-methylase UbiE